MERQTQKHHKKNLEWQSAEIAGFLNIAHNMHSQEQIFPNFAQRSEYITTLRHVWFYSVRKSHSIYKEIGSIVKTVLNDQSCTLLRGYNLLNCSQKQLSLICNGIQPCLCVILKKLSKKKKKTEQYQKANNSLQSLPGDHPASSKSESLEQQPLRQSGLLTSSSEQL